MRVTQKASRYDGRDRSLTVSDYRIQPEPNTGCWLWAGVISRKGYGSAAAFVNGSWRIRRAHRLAWEAARGPIPSGLVIDHVCRVRSCVNPDHLRAVTVRINALENNAGPVARNSAKTECPRCGSAFVVVANGSRQCKMCIARKRALRALNPEYVERERLRSAKRNHCARMKT